jgi:hypothetical protein
MRLHRLTSTTLLVALSVATGFATYKVRAAVHPSVSEHLDTARVQSQLGNDNEAGGYAQSMLMGPKIHVHLNYGDAVQLEDCDRAVAGAFDMWETALGHQIHFELVDTPKEAEVEVTFGKNVKLKGQIVSGYINWSRSISTTTGEVKPLFSADVKLRTTDPKGRPLSFEAMRHTFGHELGHLFGLDDVKQIGKLMGPLDLRRPVSRPDESEIETVLAIRDECKSIIAKRGKGTHAQFFSGGCSCHHDH